MTTGYMIENRNPLACSCGNGKVMYFSLMPIISEINDHMTVAEKGKCSSEIS